MNEQLHLIFGTGPVGLAVMEAALTEGQRVRMVNRSGRRHPDMPDSVELMAGDASDVAFASKAAQGATHIYNATNPPYTQWLTLFPPLQAGTLAAAMASGAKYIAMENLYAYGYTHGKPMTEDMPLNAHTRKGKLRAQMSRDLLAAHESGRVRVTMGRAADFIGPRVLESAFGERVIYRLLEGKPGQFIGQPDLPHTYTYMPTIGKALYLLGQRDEALGRAWHIPSPRTVSSTELARLFGERIGKPGKLAAMPKPMLSALALVMPILREVKEMAYQFEEPFILDAGAFTRHFGDLGVPSLEEVVDQTLAWYRANPKAG